MSPIHPPLPKSQTFKQMPHNSLWYSHIILVLRDRGLYAVYIWKKSSAYALGGVNGVAAFILIDEQLQNLDCEFHHASFSSIGLSLFSKIIVIHHLYFSKWNIAFIIVLVNIIICRKMSFMTVLVLIVGCRWHCFNTEFQTFVNPHTARLCNGVMSKPFACSKGLRQGENLSPILFSLFLNDLENYLWAICYWQFVVPGRLQCVTEGENISGKKYLIYTRHACIQRKFAIWT